MAQTKVVKRMRKIMKAASNATKDFYESRKRKNPNKSNDSRRDTSGQGTD